MKDYKKKYRCAIRQKSKLVNQLRICKWNKGKLKKNISELEHKNKVLELTNSKYDQIVRKCIERNLEYEKRVKGIQVQIENIKQEYERIIGELEKEQKRAIGP